MILAITIPMIPRCALVIRSSALTIREMPYVDAARAAGFGHARIILRHMLPNVMAPYLIMLTAFLGQAILLEASLSFLGLGRPGADGGVGAHAARARRSSSPRRRRGWRSSRAWPSASPSSPSTSSATRSATRSIPGCAHSRQSPLQEWGEVPQPWKSSRPITPEPLALPAHFRWFAH